MEKDKLHMDKSGFKVPENYFSEFENHLSEKIAFEAILPKKTGFKVPDNYFESVEDSVLSKVLPKKKTKVIKMSWLYKAAGIAAIFVIGFFIYQNTNNTITDFNQLAVSDINNYIDNGYVTINTYDIAETFNDVSFTDIELNETINEDEIFNYLEQNINSYNDLSLDEE